MGNGYTFELETLLFSCACRAVAEMEGVALNHSNFSVYGDDIVAPSALYDPICSALRFLGFQPNLSKSFNSGPFRESCGGDYFRGEFVRPIFFRSAPTEPSHWYAIPKPWCFFVSDTLKNLWVSNVYVERGSVAVAISAYGLGTLPRESRVFTSISYKRESVVQCTKRLDQGPVNRHRAGAQHFLPVGCRRDNETSTATSGASA